MLAGRADPDLDRLIETTRAEAEQAGHEFTVPRSFQDVAAALAAGRAALEAGGVFPAALIDRAVDTLKTRRE